jgi:hypothetical protein
MDYRSWEDHVVTADANRLETIVAAFVNRADATHWHIDRHVVDTEMPQISDVDATHAACLAGLALLSAWSIARRSLGETDIRISEPYLMIDDEWLRNEDHAPPPHVYICLAKRDEDFNPIVHDDAVEATATGFLGLDEILGEQGATLKRLDCAESGSGLWLIWSRHQSRIDRPGERR